MLRVWLAILALGVVTALLGAGPAAGGRLHACSGTAVGGRYHVLKVAHTPCTVGRRVMTLRARHDDHQRGGAANPLGFHCTSVRIKPHIEAFRDTCRKGSRTVEFVISA